MPVIRRLPRYYRFFGELRASGVERVSSRELSQMMGLTASQIRQDLNCFGGFGQQGYGYNVSTLFDTISEILGLGRLQKTILIGAGNLGRAILSYTDFQTKGFDLIGVFDRDPNMIGKTVKDHTILSIDTLEAFCRKKKPTVAILCLPKSGANMLAKTLVELGIVGFWNFSSLDLSHQFPQAVVENVHLSDSLMTLCYEVNHTSPQTPRRPQAPVKGDPT